MVSIIHTFYGSKTTKSSFCRENEHMTLNDECIWLCARLHCICGPIKQYSMCEFPLPQFLEGRTEFAQPIPLVMLRCDTAAFVVPGVLCL